MHQKSLSFIQVLSQGTAQGSSFTKSSSVSACQSFLVAWLLLPVFVLGANAKQDPVTVSLPLNLGLQRQAGVPC